jgi:hypothetical protein
VRMAGVETAGYAIRASTATSNEIADDARMEREHQGRLAKRRMVISFWQALV